MTTFPKDPESMLFMKVKNLLKSVKPSSKGLFVFEYFGIIFLFDYKKDYKIREALNIKENNE